MGAAQEANYKEDAGEGVKGDNYTKCHGYTIRWSRRLYLQFWIETF